MYSKEEKNACHHNIYISVISFIEAWADTYQEKNKKTKNKTKQKTPYYMHPVLQTQTPTQKQDLCLQPTLKHPPVKPF